eukprot:CAMPEP_0168215906 /NCGR_PEP_ID=MMETSP0140_2-20121125/6268_1 /TAXON_ID=44445 /ORGANISM="Pseudo-nitzschia australis, Strain 10249 10 AB" /LENGTH=335 /DNA_ID=CAMNT_0008143235 /DNA_START=270 /DNA_END=1277 /DNA_ORIENTATION=+
MIPTSNSNSNDTASPTVSVRSFVSPVVSSVPLVPPITPPSANNNSNNNNNSQDDDDDDDDLGMNDLVKINAGGTLFLQARRGTLCQAPDDALFTRIFSKNPNGKHYSWQNCYNNGHSTGSSSTASSSTTGSSTASSNGNAFVRRLDDEGRVFLDHDPELVEIVINFLRAKRVEDPSDPILESPVVPPHKRGEFRRLLNHFGLTGFFFYGSASGTTSNASNSNTCGNSNSTTGIPSSSSSSFRSTTGRSIRSMSIDEDNERLVVVYNDDDDDDDDHRVLPSGVVSVTKDSHSVSSSRSGVTVDEHHERDRERDSVEGDNREATVVPCPLGYDYCYG